MNDSEFNRYLDIVCGVFSVEKSAVLSGVRERTVVDARFTFWDLMLKLKFMSRWQMARRCKVHRSTFHYALKRVDALLGTNSRFAGCHEKCRRLILRLDKPDRTDQRGKLEDYICDVTGHLLTMEELDEVIRLVNDTKC